MAVTELDKDLTVVRLRAGFGAKLKDAQSKLKAAKTSADKKRLTLSQTGTAKINGRPSVLQKIKAAGKLTPCLRKKLAQAISDYMRTGELKTKGGLRDSMRKILKDPSIGRETARRMSLEFKHL